MSIGISMMVVSALILPTLRKQFPEPQLIVFGIFASLLTALQFCYFSHIYQLAILIPAFAFAMGIINPVCESLLSSSVETKDQALVLGLSTSAFTFLQAIAPGIGGFVMQNYGFHFLGILGVFGSASALAIGYLLPVVEKPKTS
ncbi:hypothetical protein FO519_010677 [Halicephalobus sp. NKZ332]|nr:hypothetical protein FO519_010677 [Halicephalobus sp. NKZ332]